MAGGPRVCHSLERADETKYAVAAAIVVVGVLWAGLPVGTLPVLGLVVMCPLMMFVMMGGMGGMGGGRTPRDKTPGSMDSHDDHIMR